MDSKEEQSASDAPVQQTEGLPEQPQPVDSTEKQPVDQKVAQPTSNGEVQKPEEAATSDPQQPVEEPDSSSLEQPSDTQVQTSVETPQPAADSHTNSQKNMGVFGHAYVAGGKQKMIKKLVAVFAVVVVVAVVGLIAKSLFFGGGRIGKLVTDTQDGIMFMRPDAWKKATTDDDFTYFTEDGVNINEVDLGLLLGSESFGVRYDSLSEEEKQTVKSSFETQFGSIDTSLTDGSCSELKGVSSSEAQREGYDLAFSIEATCSKLKDKETGGTVKIVLGWHDTELHIFGVVADDATWESDGKKLDEIVASAKPAE